jgi:hypothetical protein
MHRFAAAVASLTAALLATFLLVEDTRPSGSVVVPVLAAVFVVAVGAWGATTEAARSAWHDRQRGAGMRKLGEECLRLADELDRFLAERRKAMPKSESVTEEEAREEMAAFLPDFDSLAAEFALYIERLQEHDQETMRLYEQRFAAPVFRVVRGLHNAGMISDVEARQLPYPGSFTLIASLSRQLRQHGIRLSG